MTRGRGRTELENSRRRAENLRGPDRRKPDKTPAVTGPALKGPPCLRSRRSGPLDTCRKAILSKISGPLCSICQSPFHVSGDCFFAGRRAHDSVTGHPREAGYRRPFRTVWPDAAMRAPARGPGSSLTLEARRPLLEERADALLVVLAVVDTAAHGLDALEGLRAEVVRGRQQTQFLLEESDHHW